MNEAAVWSVLTGFPVKSVRREPMDEVESAFTIDGVRLNTGEQIILEIEGDEE